MESKDQGRRPKDWKVVAAIATASALGLTGLALADSNDNSDTPDPINLEDRTPVTEVTVAKTTSSTLADLGVRVDSLDSAGSPFDEPAAPPTTIADSAASAASADPAPAPAPAPAPEPSADSPDPAPAPVADDSAASASADSGASADNSADS